MQKHCLGKPVHTSCHLTSGGPPELETEMRFTHEKDCFVGLSTVVTLVFLRINFRLVRRGCEVCRHRRRRRLRRGRGLSSRVLFVLLLLVWLSAMTIGFAGRICCSRP